MFDENYEVPTKPPLYLFEGRLFKNTFYNNQILHDELIVDTT